MKIKSLLTAFALLVGVLCVSATAFANSEKAQAIDYLKQAAVNTSKAQNLAYDVSLNMDSPVAEGSATMKGKYAEPMLISGKMNIAVNVWIANLKYDMNIDYFSEMDDGNLVQYFKANATPPIAEQNKWYVSKSDGQENFQQIYAEEKQKSVDRVDKDIKNIFMYDVDNDTSKIYVTYHRPIVDIEEFKLAKQTQKVKASPLDDKNLQAIFTKPRDLTYEVTIDKKHNTIEQVNADLSKVIKEVGSEYLDTMPKDKLTTEEGFDVRSVIKNYLDRSKFTVNINISDINKTKIDAVPQEAKDTAIDASKINASETEAAEQSGVNEVEANEYTSGVGTANK